MTDWLTATAMLLSGLIVGFMFLYGMRRRSERSDLEGKDLEAKRDALIAELRAEVNPDERSRLEGEAAAVLRKLDSGAPALRPATSETAGRNAGAPRSGALVGFLWGAVSVGVLAGIGFWVVQQAKPRENADAPITGGLPQRQQPANTDAELQQLEAAVRASPDDLNARNDLAKAYLDRENIEAVVEHTDYVLKKSPNDARSLTYQALVRVGIGQAEAALPMFERATKVDPTLLDAWVGLAWVHAQANRMKEAEAAIATAKRLRPDQAERLDALLTRIRPGSAPSENAVQITLNVAPDAPMPERGVVFVIARAAGVSSGPPIAVKRLPLRPFPFDVDISTADSMTGQPLPPKVMLDVRLDADGDPMTKTAADLKASQDGVAIGQKVTLTLR